MTRLNECENVEDYVNQIVNTAHKLNSVGMSVSDEWEGLGTLLLCGLPDCYRPMIMGIESSGIQISADAIKVKLIQDVKLEETTGTGTTSALFTKKKYAQKSKNGPRCYECNKFGHIASNCRNRKNANESKSKNTLISSLVAQQFNTNSWYIESGATTHMTMRKDWLKNIKECANDDVIIANNMRLSSVCSGDIDLHLQSHSMTNSIITVKDVIYIPGLCTNLLSVSEMVNRGNSIKFDKKGCKIFNKNMELIATATLQGNLYKINLNNKTHEVYTATTNCEQHLWHRRFGHINEISLHKLKKKLLLKSFN